MSNRSIFYQIAMAICIFIWMIVLDKIETPWSDPKALPSEVV